MNDGVYTVEITMTGGTGKAHILSPAEVTVTGGEMTAKFEWSSSKYDLMIVGGENFYPVNESGNSVFEIPVYTLDEPLSVQAETIAMSEPHLIDYEIVFGEVNTAGASDAAVSAAVTETSGAAPEQGFSPVPLLIAAGTAAVCAGIAAIVIVKKRKK